MAEMRIDEILTPEQLKALDREIKALSREGLKPMDTAYVKRLKALYLPWKDELEKKGVDSDYLAYVTVYLLDKQKMT